MHPPSLNRILASGFQVFLASDSKFDSTNQGKSGHRVFFCGLDPGFNHYITHFRHAVYRNWLYLCQLTRCVELHCAKPHDLLGFFRLLPYFC